ncbi:hypothetical protein BJX68DRAFT_165724 [Aspergillus pseudodeflectus]|uniref:Uncharacterized protein n=1 Tax=Aspergillus pseudodeflectus TaxID=176178 RepID=A0ABR4L1L8_9EURO
MKATTSLTIVITTLLLSPLTRSLPLPETTNNQESDAIAPRRMIPSKTDLLSHIFASLGVEEFNRFNKLHPEEYDDGTSIDDSNAATNTVTSHANEEVPKPSGTVKVEEHVDKDSGATKTTTTTTTTFSTVAASAGGSDSAATDDMDSAAEEPQGFVDTLFEVLRKKFRETLNSSDEVAL